MKNNTTGKTYNPAAFKSLLKRVEKSKTKLSKNSKKVYAKYQQISKTYLKFHKLYAKNPDSLSNFLFLVSYHYVGSTHWTMYSSVCSWYFKEHKLDFKTWNFF